VRRLDPRALVASVLLLLGFVALWWVVSHAGWLSRAFMPTPESAFAALVQGMISGPLAGYTVATIGRMVVGWLLASLLGIALGTLIGNSPAARTWLQSTLELLRPLPASALVPVAIAVFGLSSSMVLFVVAFGAMWPVLLATIHGLASVPRRLEEVARALQLGRLAFVWKIGLPNAMPDILAGMRLSMTVSLIVSIVGEMIASQQGLGQTILLAARTFQSSELFAGIVLLGAIGFASNSLLAIAEARLLRWQRA